MSSIVHVEVSGLTGSGKSAVMGEIEIALKALGLKVEYGPDFQAEKNGTHADWQTALDLYQPTVVLTERNISCQPQAREDYSSLIAARCAALPGKLTDCPVCGAVDNERARQAREDALPVEWPDKDTVRASTVRSRSKLGKDDLARHNFAFEVAETIIGNWIVKGDKRGSRDLMIQAVDLALSVVARPAPDALRVAAQALEPFAKGGHHRTMPGLSPSYTVADFGDGVVVTVADFRRAAEALAALQAEQGAK